MLELLLCSLLTILPDYLFRRGGLDGVTPGSSCIANAYSSNHDLLEAKDIGSVKRFVLHAVDAVGLVHAMILRIQALIVPIKPSCSAGTEIPPMRSGEEENVDGAGHRAHPCHALARGRLT